MAGVISLDLVEGDEEEALMGGSGRTSPGSGRRRPFFGNVADLDEDGDGDDYDPPVSETAKAEVQSQKENKVAEKKSNGLWIKVKLCACFMPFLLLAMMAYYAIVFLNLTFVFPTRFDYDDVPFYINPATDAHHRNMERYDVWWWIIALSLLRFYSVVGTFKALVWAAIPGSKLLPKFMFWWNVIFGLTDFGVAVYYGMTIGFLARCADSPPCRSWDAQPGDPAEVAGQGNWVFKLMTLFSLSFSVLHIMFAVVLHKAVQKLKELNGEDDDDDGGKKKGKGKSK